jgi:hypothetical protein
MKKKITQSLLIATFAAGIVSALIDPDTRMEKVRELFTQYGADTFKLLNGQDLGGTGGDGHTGKGLATTERADIEELISSTDGNAFIFCVVEGKWAAYPPEPTKVGTDAMTATDSKGMPFVQTLIAALRKNHNIGKAHGISYYVDTPGGMEHRIATVWSSGQLLSRKNDTGKKFFCGTSVRASSYVAPEPKPSSKVQR